MDDVISRQSAIEILGKHCNMDYGKVCGNVAKVWAQLKDVPSAQQWIPCSERLPEEDGTYFVSGVWENGDVEVGQLEYIADEHRFSNVIYFNVDAWMPLPEPYKGGDE